MLRYSTMFCSLYLALLTIAVLDGTGPVIDRSCVLSAFTLVEILSFITFPAAALVKSTSLFYCR